MPKDGTVNEWITSNPVTCIRITLLTGTTISLSTDSRRGWSALRSLSWSIEQIEFEIAVIRIIVFPVPGYARRFDGQIGGRRVELEKQDAERRQRDDDKDHHRNDGPQHLDERIVGGARRHRIGGSVELDHHIDQQPQDEHRDARDDPQHEGVEAHHVFHDGAAGFLQPDLPGRGLPQTGKRRTFGQQQGCGQRRNNYRSQEHRHCRLSSLDGGRACAAGIIAPRIKVRFGHSVAAGATAGEFLLGAARPEHAGAMNHNSAALAMCLAA